MQTSNTSGIQEEQLQHIIAGFINQLYETGGNSISHVSVTVHGELRHFSPRRIVNDIPVTKIKGVNRLWYQEIPVKAALPNIVTLIATDHEENATL